MPRRRRRRTAISGAAVAERARWAGMLGEPELTPEEQCVLREHQKDSWTPQAALNVLWNCFDVFHGDPWSLASFETALAEDRAEIDQMLERYPEQRDRASEWVREIERLAVQRESDPEGHAMGEVYQELSTLGYQSGAMNVNAGKKNGESDAH